MTDLTLCCVMLLLTNIMTVAIRMTAAHVHKPAKHGSVPVFAHYVGPAGEQHNKAEEGALVQRVPKGRGFHDEKVSRVQAASTAVQILGTILALPTSFPVPKCTAFLRRARGSCAAV